MIYRTFYDCHFMPVDMPEERRIQIARDEAARSIAEYIRDKITMEYDPRTNTVRGACNLWPPCRHRGHFGAGLRPGPAAGADGGGPGRPGPHCQAAASGERVLRELRPLPADHRDGAGRLCCPGIYREALAREIHTVSVSKGVPTISKEDGGAWKI